MQKKKMKSLTIEEMIIIGFCVLIAVLFCIAKAGFQVDEIFSYGLANSAKGPFITWAMDGTIQEKVISNETLMDYVSVKSGEGFNYSSVISNQANDVHPPLFYLVLHTVSSLVPQSFSKWIGIVPNLIYFAITLVLLLWLSGEVLLEKKNDKLVLVAYGMSSVAVSAVIFVRMYMLLTMFSVLLAYMLVRFVKSEEEKYLIGIFLSIALGLLTQYYFVFYAFFACLFVCVYLLKKKSIKKLVEFVIASFAGVAAMLTTFPAFFTQLFADKEESGRGILIIMTDPNTWFNKLRNMVIPYVRRSLALWIVLAAFIVVAIIIKIKKKKRLGDEAKNNQDKLPFNEMAVVIALPGVVAMVAVICISTIANPRYIYNVTPLLYLSVICFMEALSKKYHFEGAMKKILSSILWLSAVCLWVAKPLLLYSEDTAYHALLVNETDSPCIYVATDRDFALAEDLPELVLLNDAYVTSKPNDSKGLSNYMSDYEDSNSAIVFVLALNEYNDDFYLESIKEQYGYSDCECIHNGEYSNTYVLQR